MKNCKYKNWKPVSFIILLLIGLGIFTYGFYVEESIASYMSGFGFGMASVALFMICRYLFLITHPILFQKEIIKSKDERIVNITIQSFAFTFRISIFIQAFASVLSVLLRNMVVAEVLGFLICAEMLIYFVCYTVISRKN